MIEASCTHCGKSYRLKPELAGRMARCRGCSQMFQVPGPTLDETRGANPAPVSVPRASRQIPPVSTAVLADDEVDPLLHPHAKRIIRNEDWYSPQSVRTPASRPVHAKHGGSFDALQFAFIGLFALIMIGAGSTLFWLLFLRDSQTGERSATSDPVAIAQVKQERTGPPAENQPENVKNIGVQVKPVKPAVVSVVADAKDVRKPVPTDRLAVFRMPGDLPYGQFPEEPVGANAVGKSALRSMNLRIHADLDQLVRALESIVQDAKSVNDGESLRFLRAKSAMRFDGVQRRFRHVVDGVSRTTKVENAAIHDEFSTKLASLVRELDAENRRIAKMPGQSSGIVSGTDEVVSMHSRFETLIKDRVAPELKETTESAAKKRLPIDPVNEPNYAEIRVAGLDSDEAKALVARRISEIPTVRKTYRKTYFDAPYRIVVWPADSIGELAAKIDFGEVLHTEGKEIWVWAMPLEELKAQRERLIEADSKERVAQYQAAEELKRREIADRERFDREADQLFDALLGQTKEQIEALHRGGDPFEAFVKSSPFRGSKPNGSPTMPDPSPPSNGTVTQGINPPSRTVPAKAKPEKPDIYENVDIALAQIYGNGSISKALETLKDVDYEGKQGEVVAAVRHVLSGQNSWTHVDDVLAVLDRCPGPDRVEIAVSYLDGKIESTTNWLPALARWKDPLSIDPLAAQLGSLTTRPEVSAILVSFGPAAEKAVLKLVTDPDVFTRNAAWEVLGSIGGRASIAAYRKNQMTGFDDTSAKFAIEAILKRQSRKGASRR